MNRIAVAGMGLLCLLFLIGVTIADPQETIDDEATAAAPQDAPNSDLGTEQQPASQEEADGTDDASPAQEIPRLNQSSSRSRGVRIDEDGFVYGQVVYIDPHSLDQVPVPGAIVTFIQQRSIVAQAKTGADGFFTVKGLAPYATYSMFVRSTEWMCIFGTYVSPEDQQEQTANASSNKLVFASFQQQGADNSAGTLDPAAGNPQFHAIQVIPWQDFLAALHLGIFGELCGEDCGCAACCESPGMGGGGGGGAGAGYGAAAAAAWAAAAAAWGGGAGGESGVASPFAP